MGGETAHYPDLAGQVAVVTGASRGIGAGVARRLATEGVHVALNGRDEAALSGVVAEIEAAGGVAAAVPGDCTDAAALAAVRERTERSLGPVSLLVAFAGGQGDPVPSERLSEALWRTVLDENLTATFLTLQAFLPGMIERHGGAIVTMASTAGRLPGGASVAYAAAKAGVLMLSRHLAKELGPHGVRVNCVAPGAVLTERSAERMPPEVQRQVAALHPLGRLGRPDDVAATTLFLLSEASSWVTGNTVDVCGGRVIL